MNAIDDANQRLENALLHLEEVLRSSIKNSKASDEETLERLRLEKQVKVAKNEITSLKDMNNTLVQRLDVAIDKVQNIIAK
ncbi:MAG: hypothetical protein P8M15_02495 [Alphaproteobacteria bacterium]|jgi:ElaB/YqjD/DUF883 family membrane-anchored ribosome-binding protein|nr:hypothetical protein [Alphaproteobacteria bacterium]|tara:strand:- start:135 stop:377 length:243 start_codon:yes stop_codon:yes gene_type:complete